MSGKYILEEKTPVLTDDLLEWAKWLENADRRVAKTTLPNGVEVSTVFLGLDHSFSEGKPLLFETMIFGGEHDTYQERYTTWEEAEAGHQRAIELASDDKAKKEA